MRHFDTLEIAIRRSARPICFRACRMCCATRCRRGLCGASLGHQPAAIVSRARWRTCRCCANPTCQPCTRPAHRSAASCQAQPARRPGCSPRQDPFRAGVRNRPILGAARGRSMRRFPRGRGGVEYFQLSLDPRRLHLRRRRTGTRLRRHSRGPGNVEQQLELIEAYRPSAYSGTPDF